MAFFTESPSFLESLSLTQMCAFNEFGRAGGRASQRPGCGDTTHIRTLALTMAVVFTPLALAKTTGWLGWPHFCIIYTCARRAFGHEPCGFVSLRAAPLLVLNPDETA